MTARPAHDWEPPLNKGNEWTGRQCAKCRRIRWSPDDLYQRCALMWADADRERRAGELLDAYDLAESKRREDESWGRSPREPQGADE